MVTVLDNGGRKDQQFVGKSTDIKPTEGVTANALFLELDTGDVYYFDSDAQEWNKVGGTSDTTDDGQEDDEGGIK